jgi:hypothetical protein
MFRIGPPQGRGPGVRAPKRRGEAHIFFRVRTDQLHADRKAAGVASWHNRRGQTEQVDRWDAYHALGDRCRIDGIRASGEGRLGQHWRDHQRDRRLAATARGGLVLPVTGTDSIRIAGYSSVPASRPAGC